jgi:hypothetical protein
MKEKWWNEELHTLLSSLNILSSGWSQQREWNAMDM